MRESEMTIKRVSKADVEAFKQIRLEALRLEPANFASSFEDWVQLPDDEWVRRMSEPVLIAFDKDEPVGIMGLMRQPSSRMRHRATVVMVYVRENQRGTTTARELLKALCAEAWAEGIKQLELNVSSENPAAIRFYEREGFSQIGRIPFGFFYEGREIDDLIMARRLTGPPF